LQIEEEKLKRAIKLKTIGYLGNAKNKFSTSTCNEMGIVVFDEEFRTFFANDLSKTNIKDFEKFRLNTIIKADLSDKIFLLHLHKACWVQ
jgi:hypothetical protein